MNKINELPPFKRFCVTIGNLPSSYVDSMSYYECIMWLCKYLKDTVVPTVNENAEAVNELINWFNNLDVQDEIDNKLDEMASDGTLAEIIEGYATIPQLTSRVESLESEQLTEMVVIGDSYSSRTYLAQPNKLWCEILSDYLDLTLHNYGDPGAGFLADGDERNSTFITQLDEAHADTSFNDSKVKYVFIYGGLNDLRYSNQTNKQVHINAYNSCFDKARSYFPQAKIIYLGCDTLANFGSKQMSDNEYITELWVDKTIKRNCTSFYNKNIICIDMTLFFIGMTALFEGGVNSHPNGTAHTWLANAIINGLEGSSNAFLHEVKVAPAIHSNSTANWSIGATLTSENIYQLRLTDKTLDLYLGACITKTGTGYQCDITLPFDLRIPFSDKDDNYYLPKNICAPALMFESTHTSSGVTDQGVVNIENTFGQPFVRMYVSLQNASITIYDLYLQYGFNI